MIRLGASPQKRCKVRWADPPNSRGAARPRSGPYGAYPNGPLTVEDVPGPIYQVATGGHNKSLRAWRTAIGRIGARAHAGLPSARCQPCFAPGAARCRLVENRYRHAVTTRGYSCFSDPRNCRSARSKRSRCLRSLPRRWRTRQRTRSSRWQPDYRWLGLTGRWRRPCHTHRWHDYHDDTTRVGCCGNGRHRGRRCGNKQAKSEASASRHAEPHANYSIRALWCPFWRLVQVDRGRSDDPARGSKPRCRGDAVAKRVRHKWLRAPDLNLRRWRKLQMTASPTG